MSKYFIPVAIIVGLILGWLGQGMAQAAPVKRSHVKIVLVFHAKWCPNCQTAAEKVAYLQSRGVNAQLVDIDRNPALARKYGVDQVPAYVVVYDTGRVEIFLNFAKVVAFLVKIAVLVL